MEVRALFAETSSALTAPTTA